MEMRASVRIAARTLARSRGFVATAVVSLGLAIGLTTTIYSLLDALIDPRVDARAPAQLHRIQYFGDVRHSLPAGTVESALRTGLRAYEGLTGYKRYAPGYERTTIESGSRFREVVPLVVRSDFFSVVGTHAVEGRTFIPSDDAGQPLVVISDQLAAQLFPGGQSPIGTSVSVDGKLFAVIGVVPRSTVLSALDTDAWLLPARGTQLPISVIRLRDGVTPAQADAELGLLAARLALAAGESVRETRFYLRPIARLQFHLGRFHWALIAAVIAVLFVACGNLANLQLARGLGRGGELAVRTALGATQRQLVAMLVLENALIAAMGLVLGLTVAMWGIHIVRATIPAEIAGYLVEPRVSWHLLAAAVVSTVACLVLVGLLPALRIARVDPNELLKSRSGTGAHKRHRRVYAVMIVAQLGLALPLLIGAALVMRSAWRLDQPAYFMSRAGYNPWSFVNGTLNLVVSPGHAVPIAGPASDLVSRVRAIPGVADAAAVGSAAPVNRAVTIEDDDGRSREIPAPAWSYKLVSPSYLRTLRRSVAAGSDFVEGSYDQPAVIIDEPTQHYLWPHSSAVGRLIKFGDVRSAARWMRVVGVAHDPRDTNVVRIMEPSNGYTLGKVYRVFSSDDSATAGVAGVPLSLIVRAAGDAERTALTIRHTLWSMPSVATPYIAAEVSSIKAERAQERFVSAIFDVFALLGVALTALGVYGIVAHSVSARRREFGVRISLGATPRHIVGNVLREGNVLALAGAAIGLQLTRETIGWIAVFVNGMEDYYDAALFGSMAALLVAIIVVAALVPALRATRVDPVEALRAE
ncbi:MAG: hypothetical protein JWM41_1007 [Gemmatimonadetes bacterium]|nr:hypothetical protein [Gemmatimonadota bacterium]